MIYNLIPVTLGNLVGSVLLMGVMYYFVNKPFLEETQNHEPGLDQSREDGK